MPTRFVLKDRYNLGGKVNDYLVKSVHIRDMVVCRQTNYLLNGIVVNIRLLLISALKVLLLPDSVLYGTGGSS
jgi:hypothetical protein